MWLSRKPLAALYDLLTAPLERAALREWRRLVWGAIPSSGLGLEVGAGTGANFEYHPLGARVVAVDVSLAMLRKAQAKLRR
ncbi:MAG: class I SAM-dependent methyltransferase, partial [Thermoleophilaceae bacterium]|nr:class I SAM-dependent methyltransferase [Thermoleophilaceae bacterium]